MMVYWRNYCECIISPGCWIILKHLVGSAWETDTWRPRGQTKTGSTLHGQPLSGSTRLEQIYVRLKPGYSQVKLADHHVPIKPVTGTIPRFQKYPFAPAGDFRRIAKNSERDHTPKRRLEAVQSWFNYPPIGNTDELPSISTLLALPHRVLA